MKYTLFCKDCGHEQEVSCPMASFGEKFLKKIKCEECEGPVAKLIQNINFAKVGFKKDSKRTDRVAHKLKKKMEDKHHEVKVNKDPYYGLRD